VYNVVLVANHILLVSGVECITWGHDLQDPAVKDEYFGTQKIVRDLAALPGYDRGFVTLIKNTTTKKLN
jgi:hypothetical protein